MMKSVNKFMKSLQSSSRKNYLKIWCHTLTLLIHDFSISFLLDSRNLWHFSSENKSNPIITGTLKIERLIELVRTLMSNTSARTYFKSGRTNPFLRSQTLTIDSPGVHLKKVNLKLNKHILSFFLGGGVTTHKWLFLRLPWWFCIW